MNQWIIEANPEWILKHLKGKRTWLSQTNWKRELVEESRKIAEHLEEYFRIAVLS